MKRPKQAAPAHELWSDEETARFEAVAERDRLAPVIRLQCLGLRPEEACGLRWHRDLNLTAGTLRTQGVRTVVDGNPVEKAARTAAGKRILPLDRTLVTRQAGVRKITPYTASRHAAGSYLAHRGLSPDVIAKWLGHTDASFTMKSYVHARPEDLAPARDALAKCQADVSAAQRRVIGHGDRARLPPRNTRYRSTSTWTSSPISPGGRRQARVRVKKAGNGMYPLIRPDRGAGDSSCSRISTTRPASLARAAVGRKVRLAGWLRRIAGSEDLW